MSRMTVHWRHEPFAHDAGRRDADEVDFNTEAAQTGVLTDEHQDVINGRPLIVEDETNRVYQVSDLPPDTVIVVAEVSSPPQPLLEKAREAGYQLVSASNGLPISGGRR